MTNTLHRQGTAEELKRDYVIFTTTARGINREGSAAKIHEFLRICKKYNPVNTGSSKKGNILQDAIDFPDLVAGLGDGATSAAVFTDPPSFYEQVASVNGPMARRVADLRLALEALSRPDPEDPWWSPAPPRGPAPAGPIPVAVTTDPAGCGVSPRVAAGIDKAARILAEAGYAIEQLDPPSVAEAGEAIQQIWDTEVQGYLPKMLPMMSAEGRSVLEALSGLGWV